MVRGRTWEPKTCWNELYRDIEDLLEFKEWVEGKIQQLEDKILGDSILGSKDVRDMGIGTPVTGEKVKRILEREFDVDMSCQDDGGMTM